MKNKFANSMKSLLSAMPTEVSKRENEKGVTRKKRICMILNDHLDRCVMKQQTSTLTFSSVKNIKHFIVYHRHMTKFIEAMVREQNEGDNSLEVSVNNYGDEEIKNSFENLLMECLEDYSEWDVLALANQVNDLHIRYATLLIEKNYETAKIKDFAKVVKSTRISYDTTDNVSKAKPKVFFTEEVKQEKPKKRAPVRRKRAKAVKLSRFVGGKTTARSRLNKTGRGFALGAVGVKKRLPRSGAKTGEGSKTLRVPRRKRG